MFVTVTLVLRALPKETPVLPTTKLVPCKITVVPPVVGPVGGEKPERVSVVLLGKNVTLKVAGMTTPGTRAMTFATPGRAFAGGGKGEARVAAHVSANGSHDRAPVAIEIGEDHVDVWRGVALGIKDARTQGSGEGRAEGRALVVAVSDHDACRRTGKVRQIKAHRGHAAGTGHERGHGVVARHAVGGKRGGDRKTIRVGSGDGTKPIIRAAYEDAARTTGRGDEGDGKTTHRVARRGVADGHCEGDGEGGADGSDLSIAGRTGERGVPPLICAGITSCSLRSGHATLIVDDGNNGVRDRVDVRGCADAGINGGADEGQGKGGGGATVVRGVGRGKDERDCVLDRPIAP